MEDNRGRNMKSKKTELRPSLVAQFDDIVRKSNVLRVGCEAEFAAFALNQEDCRKKWLSAEQVNENVNDHLKRLESENSTLDTQIKHARKQAEYELQRRRAIEREKDDMARQIEVIRELLSDKNSKSILHEQDREKLAVFANSHHRQNMTNLDTSTTRLNTIMEGSASFLSDVSFDKTEEDPLGHSRLRSGKSWKRPSAPPADLENYTPPKKHREENNDENNTPVMTATISIDKAGNPCATVDTNPPKLNKSFSEPALDKHGNLKNDYGTESDDEMWTMRDNNQNARNVNYNAKPRKSILKSTPETPSMRKANSASSGLNRVHMFISKTVIKPETCVPCGRRIRFSKLAMKCKDCRAVCHPDCKDKLPLPCIPSCPSTPGNNKIFEGLLSDFAPLERPMIPRLVVNCANEVELRGLEEVGIYRVPGSDREQKELKEKFLKGRYPNLSNIHDIHIVCGCLKDFLRGLKEPLVTFNLWERFVEASDISSREKREEYLVSLIDQLPQANKDTLAFLLQHLQTVSIHPACKMGVSNLAKVFGPTLIGYSCPNPEPMKIMNETRKQHMVMEHLLEIPGGYWSDILCVDEISLFPAGTPYTPDSPQNLAPRSMLGPINTPDLYPGHVSHRDSIWKGQTPSVPLVGGVALQPPKYSKKPSRFFASPVVG